MQLKLFVTKNRQTLVWLAIAILFVPVLFQLWRETISLLGWTEGGIDLRFYYNWTREWFSGQNIYLGKKYLQGYPPASILLLYPFTGWLNWEQTRLVWAILTWGAATVILVIAIRAVWANTWQERAILLLLVLLNNGIGVGYENGQASILVIAMILASILVVRRWPVHWQTDLLAALLFITALLKPNLAMPFIWMFIFLPTGIRFRPVLLVTVGYTGLSYLAAQIVGVPLPEHGMQFLGNRLTQVGISNDPNAHFVLARLGLERLLLPISGIIWAGLGVWVWYFRRRDLWVLLGVTALVTRFWGFHWIYDNVLLVIPTITLIRIWKQGDNRISYAALLLLALNVVAILPPGNLGGRPIPIQIALLVFQASVWMVTLVYLLWFVHTRREPFQNKFTLLRR